LPVPGGTYNRSNDPRFPATVSAFRLDRFEVTVGRFRKFVEAYDQWLSAGNPKPGAGANPHNASSGWDSPLGYPADAATIVSSMKYCQGSDWTDAPGANENRPINCIFSLDAFLFCAWDGGRLPTEAEWNFAAAGGSEQRKYAWGNADPTYQHASYSCMGDGLPACSTEDLLFVGSLPAGDGKYGHADLTGNVWEWNLDTQNCCSAPWPDYLISTCNDCVYIGSGERELRGGGWYLNASYLPTAFRGWGGPAVMDIGVRCARD
jgi:formylglycine-generating enzyme required for sulfatase activity